MNKRSDADEEHTEIRGSVVLWQPAVHCKDGRRKFNGERINRKFGTSEFSSNHIFYTYFTDLHRHARENTLGAPFLRISGHSWSRTERCILSEKQFGFVSNF